MRILGFLAFFFSSLVFSQDWPRQKAVQLVVGFGPGATTDTVARLAAQKLQEALGQVFVVENRPGAGGNIATQQVKRAAADGYTILVTGGGHVNNAFLYVHVPYDPMRDFDAVTLGASQPVVLTVHP